MMKAHFEKDCMKTFSVLEHFLLDNDGGDGYFVGNKVTFSISLVTISVFWIACMVHALVEPLFTRNSNNIRGKVWMENGMHGWLHGFTQNKCFTFRLCRGYCVSFCLDLFPGWLSPLHNQFSGKWSQALGSLRIPIRHTFLYGIWHVFIEICWTLSHSSLNHNENMRYPVWKYWPAITGVRNLPIIECLWIMVSLRHS